MMMKSTKRNKRLAMMVGAALSFGVAYGMTPGDALAADIIISANDDGTTYTISATGDGASAYDSFVGTTLSESDFKTNLDSVLGQAKGDSVTDTITVKTASTDATSGLLNVIGQATNVVANGVQLAAGDTFDVQVADASGGSSSVYSMTAGAANDAVKYTSGSSTLEVTGQPSSVNTVIATTGQTVDLSNIAGSGTINIDASGLASGDALDITAASGGSTTIGDLKVAEGVTVTGNTDDITVGSLTLGDGAALNGGGQTITVTNATVSGDATCTDVTFSNAVSIEDGKTLTLAGTSSADSITGNGTLDVQAGATVTTTGDITAGNIVAGANITAGGDVRVGDISGTGSITATGNTVTISGNNTGTGTITANEVAFTSSSAVTADASKIAAATISSTGDLTLIGTPDATTTTVTSTGSVSIADINNITTVNGGNGITFISAVAPTNTVTLNAGSGQITADGGLDLLAVDDASKLIASAIEVTGGTFTAPNAPANLANVGTVKLSNGATLADSTVDLGSATVLDATGATDVANGGLGSTVQNVTAGTVKLNNNAVIIDGSGLTVNADSIESGGAVTVTDGSALKAADGSGAANVTAAGFDTTGAASGVEVGDLAITGVGVLTANNASAPLTAASVKLANGATVASGSAVTTNKVTLDASGGLAAIKSQVDNLTVNAVNNGDTVEFTLENPSALSDAEKAELETFLNTKVQNGTAKVTGAAPTPPASGNSTAVMNDIKAAVGDEVAALVAANAAVVANVDPFVSKLPSADALAKLEALSNVNGRDLVKEYYDALKSEGGDVSGLSPDAKTQAARLTAAVQQAGKTAAAPGVTAARAATAITAVLTDNVVNRNAEIRDFAAAAAVDDGRPAPDRVWFQYKHTNMDVDGDVYEESNVNTNTFQLGYDAKLGENDYLGVFVGTTTGDAEFKGPKRSGRMDIDGSFDVGIYGTHMLPQDQYIDYMIHTGNFDSEYAGSKWGTTDTGAMVGYGVKIASSDSLTLNPYVQLAYDKIDVDSYWAGPNYITNDDSDNWTAKLGMNVIDASGLYGGLAYSRGLSGSYNAYINGVPMPSSDFNANVLYLSLGYRANMSKNAVLDLSMEKTFMDYDGWTASGKVNFYF